ncbi:hypothetical protein DFP72DRAFT_889855 [Ephemerocybe angulata]|uniref:DUF4470 domain-containing protein n=1 Tax=Ephemerocybe angulata TaxID=980116 RepID=A0A8H6M9Q1_9AGAR|nr:hypothetical protein DFP72DRAFT_889855 [Tulosesus angulatus]
MAEIAKDKGSAAYRRGDFEGAIEAFALAARTDPVEPVYTSNLSAVYYEQGQYTKSAEAIISSWRALRAKNPIDGNPGTPPLKDPLAPKLATRFAKAKLNGVLSGQFSLHDKKPKKKQTSESNYGIESDIELFVNNWLEEHGPSSKDAKVEELRLVWSEWRAYVQRCNLHEREACQEAMAEAQRRLRDLPIFRKALETTVEYYKFGNDPVRSMFDGVNKTKELTIDVHALRRDKLLDLAFLFGGSGDARHAFGTIFHLSDICSRLKRHEKTPTMHLTLVDIHPATLARVMLVFALIRKLLRIPRSDERRLDYETTIFYMYTTILMPDYCHSIVVETARELFIELTQHSKRNLTKSFHVGERSLAQILPIIEYWSVQLPKTTKEFLQVNPAKFIVGGVLPSGPMGNATNSLTQNPAYLKALRGAAAQRGVREKYDIPCYDDPDAEQNVYDTLKVLLPPSAFLDRHPNLEKYIRKQGGTEESRRKAAQKEIEETWKPNPTMFDNSAVEHNKFSYRGYPVISSSPHDILRFYLDAAIYIPEIPNKLSLDTTAFAIVIQFFRLAMQGIDELDEDLTVEFVAGDVIAGIGKLVNGDLGPRPAHFPKKYLRMWLNNVPDYTSGPLGSIVHLVPYLQPSKYSMVLSNCLLNCSSFANLNELLYNYTYCHSKTLKRMFAVLYRDENGTTFDEMNISPLQDKPLFSSVVPKKELHTYLKTMLLRFLCPPRSPQMPYRIDEPGTLAYFFHFLLYLVHQAGCPPHWIAEIIQSVIDDNLVTDIVPYTGMLPISSKTNAGLIGPAARKVNLKPWRAEIEAILLSIRPIIPFALTFPPELASLTHEDVRVYTTPISSTVEHRMDVSPFVKTAGLIFYGPQVPSSAINKTISNVVGLLDDAKGMPDVQLMSMQETLDLRNGVVSWRMSKAWYEKMVKEDWKMMVYVSNQALPVTRSVDARMWMDSEAGAADLD